MKVNLLSVEFLGTPGSGCPISGLAGVAVLVVVLVLVTAVLILVVVLILILVVILVLILVLVIHNGFLQILFLRSFRYHRMPSFSSFILCLKKEAGKKSCYNSGCNPAC